MARIGPERIYLTAFRIYRASFWFLLGVAVLFEVIGTLGNPYANVVFMVFLYLAMVFHFHRAILLGETYGFKDLLRNPASGQGETLNWAFSFRFMAICLIPAIVCIATIYWVFQNAGDAMRARENFGYIAGVFAVIPASLVFLLIAAMVGTLLPASAVHADASLRRAFQRGRKTFWVHLILF